jgi:hypothetical protein
MSIINDALKKARREGQSPVADSARDDTVIRPRRAKKKPPGPWTVLSAVIVVLGFVGLAGGLGYFVYKEYFPAETARDEESIRTPEKPAVGDPGGAETAGEDRPVPTSPGRPEKTDESAAAGAPASSREETASEPPPETTPPESPGEDRKLRDRFVINGVMRASSGTRLLTNSGVYREGDEISSPPGYEIVEIGDDTAVLRAPDGSRRTIPLP